MINYASESSQSETEKYFELIIIINYIYIYIYIYIPSIYFDLMVYLIRNEVDRWYI